MIELNEARIPRRGQGAKGTVEVKLIGIPELDKNGVAIDVNYDVAKHLDFNELVEYAQNQGIQVNEAICFYLDWRAKKAAIKAGSAASELQFLIMADYGKDEKQAKILASWVISTSKNLNLSQEDCLKMIPKS